MQNVCDNCFSHSLQQQQQLQCNIFTGSLSASAGSGPNEQRRTWNDIMHLHMQPFGVALTAETQQHVPFASIFRLSMLRSFGSISTLAPLELNCCFCFPFFVCFDFCFQLRHRNQCYENVFDRYREGEQILRKWWTERTLYVGTCDAIVCIECDFPMKWLKIKIAHRNWMLTLGKIGAKHTRALWNERMRSISNWPAVVSVDLSCELNIPCMAYVAG